MAESRVPGAVSFAPTFLALLSQVNLRASTTQGTLSNQGINRGSDYISSVASKALDTKKTRNSLRNGLFYKPELILDKIQYRQGDLRRCYVLDRAPHRFNG